MQFNFIGADRAKDVFLPANSFESRSGPLAVGPVRCPWQSNSVEQITRSDFFYLIAIGSRAFNERLIDYGGTGARTAHRV